MERTNHEQIRMPVKMMTIGQKQPSKAEGHACKASLRGYQQARDHLKRAERDLAETAAFIAASLTTVTAIQAVITVARDKLELSKEILQLAFQGYAAVFLLILLLGSLRVSQAMRRRTWAEKDIDQTRKGIFEFCDEDQWRKTVEKE
jgi:hypothetical protein